MNVPSPETTEKVEMISYNVMGELYRAMIRFPKFNSPHEGYAVILEELDEAWEEIKKNDTKRAIEEMTQVAAMAIRFLVDCGEGANTHE
ncbi:hypothetical protein HMSSN036_51900 [Paenibacillus macerans]|nr:hypothetical protein HMSSN036_51900 [Paenibacillus macerans]